jgi:isocitrate/isopropylmalate dehydrogenase
MKGKNRYMADQRIQQKIDATLIPEDGIGPEIVASTVDILAALGSPFVWDRQQGGLAGIESSARAIRFRRACSTASGARGSPDAW